jgi:hypothetical protein
MINAEIIVITPVMKNQHSHRKKSAVIPDSNAQKHKPSLFAGEKFQGFLLFALV